MGIKVEISGRHIHLSEEHLHKLFGQGYNLSKKRDISQPGQYVAHEKVILTNGIDKIENVKILGPVRKNTQIEILEEDARLLKINAPIRKSGDIKNSPGIRIIGPLGLVEINEGMIKADRHIHLPPEEAMELGLKDGDYAKIKIDKYTARFLVRAGIGHKSAIHIDKDEASRLGLRREQESFGEIIKILKEMEETK